MADLPLDMDPDDESEEEAQEGELVGIDEDEPDVEDTEDGGAIVRLDDEEEPNAPSPFYENLAATLPRSVLKAIGARYIEMIGRDKESRKKRDDQYEEGIRRTGLGDDAPGGAQFQGASKVVHPLLTEVCVDFSSRAIKELFPPGGPAKSHIVGDITKDRIAKARRKTEFFNWQLTVQATEFRAELEQLLTQLPLGGAQYLKVTWDRARNRPNFMFVAIDDMLLPYAATNFYTAERRTHVQYLTETEYRKRVRSKMYVDADLPSAGGMTPDQTAADKANDKIEGREDSSFNQDGLRIVFESDCLIDISEFGDADPQAEGTAPYLLSLDKTTGEVLGLYRNWDEDDATQEALLWTVEFPFVPWRGAYPIGMTHMIGGLSGAATGALRALLDSAFISNSQSMLKLKGGTAGGQSLDIQPTQVLEIEGGLNVDDIRKLAMPLPYNPPSTVLYQLLGFLVDAGKGVVRTTLDDMDASANTPVGTELARIEQGMVVFGAIHGRLHDAMGRLLRILNRLNGSYLDDEAERDEAGSVIAHRADFDGPLDVVPVSDPNIFSEAQRYAQAQAVAQRAELHPELYDARKVEEMLLATLKVPDAAALLRPGTTPIEENAVAENVKASLGTPILAFPEQDHIAHLQAHLAYMESPTLGMSALIAPSFLPVMLDHLKQHIALWYAAETFRVAQDVAGEDFEERIRKTKDKKDKQALDRLIAEASLTATQAASEVFAELPPVIAQAMQMAQKLAPQPPMDPAAQVAREDIQMRGQAAAGKQKLEEAKLQIEDKAKERQDALKAQEAARKAQAEQADAQGEAAIRLREIAAEDARNTQDNETAILIEQMKHGHERDENMIDRAHDGLRAEIAASRETPESKETE